MNPVADNSDIEALLKAEAAKEGESEPAKVVLSATVTKINRKRKAQDRVVLLTEKALYNFAPRSYKSFKRRIDLTSINSVTLSDVGDEFVLHVQGEYDYHYRTHLRGHIIHKIAWLRKAADGHELKAHLSSLDEIASFITTKELVKRQNVSEPATYNPTNSLMNRIRALVSKKKVRFRDDHFDLDLTYITDRLIAMGYPSEDLEGLYRNPYSQVYAFLESRHKDRYKVYNLCSERRYDSAKFHHRVARFPFDDHNVPAFHLILDFCLDVDEWLATHPDNVVAVHCKAGKGRTGLMLACYMVYCQMFSSAADALADFGAKRTINHKGVTIPSQQRYVKYFELYLRRYVAPGRSLAYPGVALNLESIRVCGIPPVVADDPSSLYFKIYKVGGDRMYSSSNLTANGGGTVILETRQIVFTPSVRVCGDFKVQFCRDSDKLFHFWINTNFVDGGAVTFSKNDLDKAIKDKQHKKFQPDFRVEVRFSDHDVIVEEASDEEGQGEDIDFDASEGALGQATSRSALLERIAALEEQSRAQTLELLRLKGKRS